jgi:fumarate reductase subunit C
MSNVPPRATGQYVRPVRADWWLQKKSYTLFMLRELTAVFAGGYAIFLIVLIYQATRGDTAFDAFVLGLMSPLSIVLHAVVFLMVLYHTYTWFSLLPKVAVFWRGEEKISGTLLVGANWIAWLVLMALVIVVVMQWR